MATPKTDYEPLEDDITPTRSPTKRFTWRNLAIAVGIVVAIVWFAGPRGRRVFSWSSANGSDDGLAGNPNPISLSFETDPDPSKTPYCIKPYTPGTPLVQYALMIDAGSAGSRIHIHKFNNCGPSPAYEYEVFKMTAPGLPAFPGRPFDAAQSLDPLLREAMRVVPTELKESTPVVVKSTGGIRLLPGSHSGDILRAVEKRLKEEYPFRVAEKGAVDVIEGKDEVVYAWITANYLLDTLHEGSGGSHPTTYAMLDIGGGFTQIAFAPITTKPGVELAEGDDRYDFEFGGQKRVLYRRSYFGYGVLRARKHVHEFVDSTAPIRAHGMGKGNMKEVNNPCVARGTQHVVEIMQPGRRGAWRRVTMIGDETASFETCNKIVKLAMAQDTVCKTKPCLFNDTNQPPLLHTFPQKKILLRSFSHDLLVQLFPEGPITPEAIANAAQDVCLGRPAWLARWGTQPDVIKELARHPEWCLDLTFMYTLLRNGYGLEERQEMETRTEVRGTELGWFLGATLLMVGGKLDHQV